MYQALYRKWRPQTFDEVIGQDHITHTLKNQVKADRLSHAYLFIGTRGTGKTTCARILAKAANCENPVDGNPCGRCAACRSIADGTAVDLVELDAASNNGVDNVRALREEAVFSPATLKKRVYIIDEVHMLSPQAFNALLKIREEPPKHLMFILCTTELQKIPATILSRCQRHSFHRVDAKTLADYLSRIAGKEGLHLAPDASELIARLADGGVRDALSLLDQCSAAETIGVDQVTSAMGLAGKRRIAGLLDRILADDAEAALKEFASLWMDGKDPASLMTELNGLMRDIMVLKVAPKGGYELLSGNFELGLLRDLTRKVSMEELLRSMNILQQAIAGLRDARNPKTAAELCLVTLCEKPDASDPEGLRARIARLERRLEQGDFAAPRASAIPVTDPEPEEAPPFGEGAAEEPEEDEAPPAPWDELEEIEARAEPYFRSEARDADENEDEDSREEFLDDEPSSRGETEEDFPDPDAFYEPQPEDQIPATPKKDDPEPAEPRTEPAPASEPSAPAPQSPALPDDLWEQIRDKAAQVLPRELRGPLKDENKVRGHAESGTLVIEVVAGFLEDRFRQAETLRKLDAAAQEALGRQIRIQIRQMSFEARPVRPLDELKGFQEVSIT